MRQQETIVRLIKARLSMLQVNDAIREKRFQIPIHMGLGHEALAVALAEIKSPQDCLVLSHRNMHYNFAVQNKPSQIFSEYLLSKEGVMEGQYGSMNLIQPDNGVVYTSSILGNNLCVASGIAKANQVNETILGVPQTATFVVTGDGAMEEGAFYESILMARTCKVPMVIIVENNGWSMYTQIHERRFPIDLKKFGDALDVPTFELKGNDVFEYIDQLSEIRTLAIEQQTPVIVEVLLHTLGDYWVEDPKRRNINYHHGLAPKITDASSSIIVQDDTDPLYVASKLNIIPDWENLEQRLFDEVSNIGGAL
jgi:pyruvate dehydrogenase E1 component alpha subunit